MVTSDGGAATSCFVGDVASGEPFIFGGMANAAALFRSTDGATQLV